MALEGLSTGMTFPLEIVDQIIDEIAYSRELALARTTLRACRLASRLFKSTRKHLFARIEFLVDDNAYERAARLLAILEHSNNKDLLPYISSITIMGAPGLGFGFARPGANGMDDRIFRVDKSMTILQRIKKQVKRFRPRKAANRNHIVDLFQLFCSLAIKEFSCMFLDLYSLNISLASTILYSRFQSPINSLSLCRVQDISLWLVPELVSETLTELKLNDVRLPRDWDIFECMPNLVSLELLSEVIINEVGMPLIVVQPYTPPPSKYLSHLNTLAVTVLGTAEELGILVGFIYSVAPTLETLALHLSPFTPEIYNIWKLDPHFLSRLMTLKTLKFQFGAHFFSEGFQTNLFSIGRFLATMTSVTPIQSIIMDLTLNQGTNEDINIAQFLWPLVAEWAELDRQLTNPMLAILQEVRIDIRKYHGFGDQGDFNGTDVGLDVKSSLFPGLHAHPSIQFDMVVESIFTIQ